MKKKETPATDSATISLADEDRVQQVLVNSVLGLWDVVNDITRLRPSTNTRYRVTIFGSARVQTGSFGYETTKRCAAELAKLGCDIITGGGPGLMQAANEGAASAPQRSKSIGIRVDLPFEQEVNSFVRQAFEHRTFFTRLHQFVLTSDAFIVAPGGIGTILETLMIWQLLQVHHLSNAPLVLVGSMWPGLIDWARQSLLSTDPPLANPEDLNIPQIVATGDEAVALIRKHRGLWLRKNGKGTTKARASQRRSKKRA